VPYSMISAFEQSTHANNARVFEIFVVTDGGWFISFENGGSTTQNTQTILFKNIRINNQVFFNHVSCPQAGEDTDSKQQQHEGLCEEKAGHDEQENGQIEQGTEQSEQNQQNTDDSARISTPRTSKATTYRKPISKGLTSQAATSAAPSLQGLTSAARTSRTPISAARTFWARSFQGPT